jgi:peroxiredoxin
VPFVLFLQWAGSSGDRVGLVAAAAAIRRFSGLGLVAMTILTGTGVFNLWEHVPSVPALLGTPYGHWLSVKLGVGGLLLGVAAGNRWIVKPRLLALARTDGATFDRLLLLNRVAATLRDAGLEMLAVPLQPDPALDRQRALRAFTLPIVADGAAEVAATYRLFEGPRAPSASGVAPRPLAHMELLIDPQGALRARWIPDHEPAGWANPARLQAAVLRLVEEQGEAPASGEHTH